MTDFPAWLAAHVAQVQYVVSERDTRAAWDAAWRERGVADKASIREWDPLIHIPWDAVVAGIAALDEPGGEG